MTKREMRTCTYIAKGGASSANKLIRILISGDAGCGRSHHIGKCDNFPLRHLMYTRGRVPAWETLVFQDFRSVFTDFQVWVDISGVVAWFLEQT